MTEGIVRKPGHIRALFVNLKGGNVLEDILRKYFKYVFTEDFFTVALDATGCFLFSSHSDDTEITSQFNQFKSCQCLSDKQCVLCVVGRKSNLSYCSQHLLDSYIMKITQGRESVLSWEEQHSILECYKVPVEANTVSHEEPVEEESEESCLNLVYGTKSFISYFVKAIILLLLGLIIFGCWRLVCLMIS